MVIWGYCVSCELRSNRQLKELAASPRPGEGAAVLCNLPAFSGFAEEKEAHMLT